MEGSAASDPASDHDHARHTHSATSPHSHASYGSNGASHSANGGHHQQHHVSGIIPCGVYRRFAGRTGQFSMTNPYQNYPSVPDESRRAKEGCSESNNHKQPNALEKDGERERVSCLSPPVLCANGVLSASPSNHNASASSPLTSTSAASAAHVVTSPKLNSQIPSSYNGAAVCGTASYAAARYEDHHSQ